MAAAASSSSAAAAAHVAHLPQPQAMSSSGHGRPTSPQEPLPFLISQVARSEANGRALLAQIASRSLTQQQRRLHHNKETIESTLLQRVKEKIDAQLAAKGIKDIITLSPDLTSIGRLLRLVYFIDNSGEWAGWEPIVRVAKHQERVERLPIELTGADVEGVGRRAVFDGRCEALRQLSLIQRHINIALERDDDGEERLGGSPLTIRTLQTLPAGHPFHNGLDPANPVCEDDGGNDYASVRDAVLCRMCSGGSEVADHLVYPHNDANARYHRLRQLLTQQPPVWNRHTISTFRQFALRGLGGVFFRVIVLHGDQPNHTFTAHIFIYSSSISAHAFLFTTERPVMGVGAARFTQTVRVVRKVMGADAQVAFGNRLDVAVD
ncbi:unnamed protein product [Vitrella brassicaformis CCMP3155]|uniref:Uncharacterized protein n=1 Tax=Vitrella brassicaformis (strain CCMP3155) TaxID=1169540 RepID=A0A0G4FYZ4_VITBC|nr:unnamed protein product [Vitrella brassicaformis CCMP3155]|eukprot:CEM20304.1 unnamed protein product [Vitrella brassicaformis CCMP3155]